VVERGPEEPCVDGSIPSPGTIFFLSQTRKSQLSLKAKKVVTAIYPIDQFNVVRKNALGYVTLVTNSLVIG
jgi:hypothetical protein